MQWEEPDPVAEPKRRAFQSKTPCKGGRSQHRYDPVTQVCIHCGHKRPYDINVIKNGAQKIERPPRRAATRTISRQRINESLVLLMSGVQNVVKSFNPELKPLPEGDLLTDQEILMLADALADEANQSERVKQLIIKAQQSSAHAKLVITVLLIAAPRLVRHGVLPEGADQLGAAVAMAAGGAHDGNRGDELGQEYPGGGGPAPDTEVPDRDADEDGPEPPAGEVPGRNGHQEARPNFVTEVQPVRVATKVRGAGA